MHESYWWNWIQKLEISRDLLSRFGGDFNLSKMFPFTINLPLIYEKGFHFDYLFFSAKVSDFQTMQIYDQ